MAVCLILKARTAVKVLRVDSCFGALVVVVSVLFLALAAPAAALELKLTGADAATGDQLGDSVAVEGDTAVVGAPGADAGRGAVYVFARSGDSWVQTAKLTASDGAARDALGSSVAVAGETIVAGAPGDDDVGANPDRGSVYTFARTGPAARIQTAKLTASDGAAFDELGFSVAVAGETIVAGAPSNPAGGTSDPGSVYTFARTGAAARTETAKLTASDAAVEDQLGYSVAVAGETIVAGAPFDDLPGRIWQGSVYTFARTGAAARSETAKLHTSDGREGDRLGYSVAVAGETVVAGAPYAFDVGWNENQGSVYTFDRTDTVRRSETAKLTASDGAAEDQLGSSVAVAGETVVAGALSDHVGANAGQGSVYTFARTAVWGSSETAKLTASDGAAGDGLGYSVAAAGESILAGAPLDDFGGNTSRGSASIFFAPAPAPAPVGPPTGGGGGVVRDTTKPLLGPLRFSSTAFKAARSGASIRAKSKVGTKVSFSLSEPSAVKFSVQRKTRGRKAGKRCVAKKKSNAKKKPCTRWVKLKGSFTVAGQAGTNSFSFRGRVGGKRLKRGGHRLSGQATDAASNTSAVKRKGFKIVQ